MVALDESASVSYLQHRQGQEQSLTPLATVSGDFFEYELEFEDSGAKDKLTVR
jgi:hypothetical protein